MCNKVVIGCYRRKNLVLRDKNLLNRNCCNLFDKIQPKTVNLTFNQKCGYVVKTNVEKVAKRRMPKRLE